MPEIGPVRIGRCSRRHLLTQHGPRDVPTRSCGKGKCGGADDSSRANYNVCEKQITEWDLIVSVISLAEVRKSRASGEGARISYDPNVHPGIIQRLALAGLTQDSIAASLGVHRSTLRSWMDRHEEVDHAIRFGSDLADAEVVRSLYDQAVGWIDKETGRRKGVNVTAAIFWLKNRCGWRSEPLVQDNTNHKDKPASREEVSRRARELCRLLEARGENVPNVTPTEMDGDKMSVDEFPEFDTGQSDT